MILRRKSRYVLVRSSNNILLDSRDNSLKFFAEIEKLMGVKNYSTAHPKIAKCVNGNFFIVKLNRGQEDNFVLATAFVKKINGIETGLQTIKTSGAIRNLILLSKNLPVRFQTKS